MTTEELLKEIYNAAEDKKAENIKIIDISNISIMADYMFIASGLNNNQIQAMCDNILECIHKNGLVQNSLEGYDAANWILIDIGDIIVHIFDKESRSFYDLERLYQDGKYFDV